jgi:hypothetical protein
MSENRIVGHGSESPDQLLANPFNFRIHTQMQQSLMKNILEEVGWVKSVTVNKVTGTILDGHMRVILAMREGLKEVPVEYVELTEEEERKAMLLLDYVTAKAEVSKEKAQELLASITTENSEIVSLFSREMFPETRRLLERSKEKPKLEKDILKEQQLVEEDESAWDIVRGSRWQIGDSVLVCADPVRETMLYRDLMQNDLTEFYPWGGMFSGLLTGVCLIVNPDIETCRMILYLAMKEKGAENVKRLD